MLNFEGKISDLDEFRDIGYVPNLFAKTQEVFKELERPITEDYIRQCGIDLDLKTTGGLHLRIMDPTDNSKLSLIFYNQFDDLSIDIWSRAHEEAHAASHLGLRDKLEKRIGGLNLSNLDEEDFCDQAGLYALRQKNIKPHPNILIPTKTRYDLYPLFK